MPSLPEPRGVLGSRTSIAGFPNLFTLMGPNTGLGHSSVLMMVETQFAHVLRLLEELRRLRPGLTASIVHAGEGRDLNDVLRGA